jgi:hypothetical protein
MLAAGLEVDIIEQRGDWSSVRCSNGFVAWVDGRTLVPLPGSSSTTGASALSKIAELDFSFSRPMVAAAFVALAAFLPWVRGGLTASGFDVPLQYLFDHGTTSTGGLSVGLLLLVASVVGVAGLVLPGREVLRKGAGIAGAAASLLYVVQLMGAIGDAGPDVDVSLLDVLGWGVPVALAASLVLAFVKPSGPTSR